MQISATGASKFLAKPPAKFVAQGFTLLEVLLVLFILGMATSVVVLTLPASEQKQLDKHAHELVEEFYFARDYALNQHRLVGWQVNKTGYRYVVRDQLGQWQPTNSRALPAKIWPENLQLAGITGDLATEFSANLAPAVVFFPAGEVTSLKLTLHLQDASRSLEISSGRIRVLNLHDD